MPGAARSPTTWPVPGGAEPSEPESDGAGLRAVHPRRRRRPSGRAHRRPRVRRVRPRGGAAIRAAGRHASAPPASTCPGRSSAPPNRRWCRSRRREAQHLRQRRLRRGDLRRRPDPHQPPRHRRRPEITVQFDDGPRSSAELSAASPSDDIALIRPRRTGPVPADAGSSDELRSATMSSPSATPSTSAAAQRHPGIVSAKERAIRRRSAARPPHPDRRRHQPRQLGRTARRHAQARSSASTRPSSRRPEHRLLDRHRFGESADQRAEGGQAAGPAFGHRHRVSRSTSPRRLDQAVKDRSVSTARGGVRAARLRRRLAGRERRPHCRAT